jgi:hypothetical protein
MALKMHGREIMDNKSSNLTPEEWKTASDYTVKLVERMMQSANDHQETDASRESHVAAAPFNEPSY